MLKRKNGSFRPRGKGRTGRRHGGKGEGRDDDGYVDGAEKESSRSRFAAITYVVVGMILVVFGVHVWMSSAQTSSTFPLKGTWPQDASPSYEQPWAEVVDESTGSLYYWNRETGETTWRKPDEFVAAGGKDDGESSGSRREEKTISPEVSSDDKDEDRSGETQPLVQSSSSIPVKTIDTDVSEEMCGAVTKDGDLLGGDIPLPKGERYHISTVEKCCAECRKLESCWAWVYQESAEVCYLKSGIVEEQFGRGLRSGKIPGRTPILNSRPPESVPLSMSADEDDDDVPEKLKAIIPDPEDAAAGTFRYVDDPEIRRLSDELGRKRAEEVKSAFTFMWGNYRQKAMGMDELLPKSGRGQNNWGNMGVTLVDALDTLWLMDLKDDFEAAKRWVASSLDFNRCTSHMSFFETNIRMLGGLLSAFDLSGDRVFLDKAKDLADRMSPGFDTPSGLPHAQIKLSSSETKDSWTKQNSVLAEHGTLSLEWRYLSEHLGTSTYREKAERVYDVIGPPPFHGMWPTLANRKNGRPSGNTYTFGALADSFYEYLLKMWLQGGKKEPRWRKMYDEAIEGMTKNLLGQSGHLKFVGERKGRRLVNKMEHLTCFVGGMLALGAYNDPHGVDSTRAQRDLRNAKSIAYTCYRMYKDMPTGLSPEFVTFDNSGHIHVGSAKYYILRPEAAETMFVLHQLTGHPVFRLWGWEIFKAIRSKCKTSFGFGNYPDVSNVKKAPDDRAESFFLAETLKYLYLLQLPEGEGSGGVPLGKYVFNTEAHPLSVFS